jgi:hypothetical protein
MSNADRQAVIQALGEVRKQFEREKYTDANLRNRMRGAHLLAMRLLGVPWPSKAQVIPQDWWKEGFRALTTRTD